MNPLHESALTVFQMLEADEPTKLIRLRDQLMRLGVNAELRDNNAALMVHPPRGRGMPVWVFVGFGGAYYSWQQAQHKHPVVDVAGAAQALKDYVGR
jgi:hypothetical protein